MSPTQFVSLVDIKARMSLKSEASRLYLSYLWWILEPVLWALAMYFVFEILLAFGRDIFFILCGKVAFIWFSKSVTSAAGSITSAKGLINQTNMPKAFFPYLVCQQGIYRQWAVFLFLLGAAVVWGHAPTWHWLWILPLIFVEYLFILAAAMISAFLVSYIRDIKILINMSMIMIMFSSGVFWDLERIEDPVKRELLVTWNPLAYLIDAFRAVIIRGEMYDMQHLGVLVLVFVGIIVLMHGVYAVKSKDIAARVINS